MGNKTKTVRPVNGQLGEGLQAAIGSPVIPPPVIPVKSQADLLAELEAVKAENQALRNRPTSTAAGVFFRVSEKGALSVYGLGRFPVTLYREQWERLLAVSDQIKAFIAEKSGSLKRKGE